MFNGSEEKAQSLQRLSALADGELDAAATLLACAHWRGDAVARSSWHAYHLIGDVMRSDELASSPARDASFLRCVAERLASEPVVLAPQAVDVEAPDTPAHAVRLTPRSSRWPWLAPAAVAAGFMAVASVLVVTRDNAPIARAGDFLAQSWDGKASVATAAAAGGPSASDALLEPQTLVADGKLIRDARLERYFAAHEQFGGSSALGVPSGFLRAATTQAPGR